MGVIIVEGGKSVWGLDGVAISKRWVEGVTGGGDSAEISGFIRKQLVTK